MNKVTRVRLIAISAFLLVGCASLLPSIGPGNLYQPNDDEKRLWKHSREQAQFIVNSGRLYADARLTEYVQAVLEKLLSNNLAAYAPLRPRVRIVDSASNNAFAFSSGDIFVHTGILGRIRSEAQLALLLGHEVTHATHRHMHQMREDLYDRSAFDAYVSVLASLGGSNAQNLLSGLSKIVTLAAVRGYGRNKEREADRVGLILVTQAGYDPNDASKLWERLLDATEEGVKGPVFLYSSHPKMKNRVKSCKKLVQQMPSELTEQAREIGQERYVEKAKTLILGEARTHIIQGRYSLAIDTLNFLSQAQPMDSEPRALLGELLRVRGEDQDRLRARTEFEASLAIDRTNATAHRGLGLLLLTKERDLALQHIHRYLELHPTAEDAAFMAEYVEKLERQ